MTIPLILGIIAFLLLILIGYNVIQQYKEKLEAENRIAISQQNAIVNEVDDLLRNTGNIPLNKKLLILMQQRMINALVIMSDRDPGNTSFREQLDHTNEQLTATQENYKSPREDTFDVPHTDRAMLAMLKKTKKIRTIINSEHAKGNIETETFVAENHRMEIIQLKIHLKNAFSKIIKAKALKQFDNASYMITKLLKTLASVSNPDKYLVTKKSQLLQMQNEIKRILYEKRIKERKRQHPKIADTPEISDTLDAPEIPEIPEISDTLEIADTPDAPEIPEISDTSEIADAPEIPEISDTSEIADAPEISDTHDIHDIPEVQVVQEQAPQQEKSINSEPDPDKFV